MASGSAKIECDSQMVQNFPASDGRPNGGSTYSLSSGIIVTWMGTICIANTATNNKSRPGNFIQANA